MSDEVILVFTDRHFESLTAAEAEKICRDPSVRGRIMDALTSDRDLQQRLRAIMDED